MTRRTVLLQALTSTIPDVNRLAPTFDSSTQRDEALAIRQWAIGLLMRWSAREQAFQEQLTRIVTEDRPALSAAVPEVVQDFAEYTVAQAAEHFSELRRGTLGSLSGLRPGEWQRIAYVNGSGSRSLRYLVQDLVDNDIACTNQLVQLLVEYRRAELATSPTQEQIAP